MAQMSWRVSGELLDRVRRAAAHGGVSLNEYVTRVLDAATNPDHASDEAQRLRERLARAGLLAPAGRPRTRPDPDALARASKAAAEGKPLPDLVSEGRG